MKLLAFILLIFGIIKVSAVINYKNDEIPFESFCMSFNKDQFTEIAKMVIIIDGILEILFAVFVLLNPVFK